ncbi:ribonuclease H-like domain-containing protein [Tanacetum coccineum]
MDKCKASLGYNAAPPPITRNFMPPKPDLVLRNIDDYANKPVDKSSEVKTCDAKPETVRRECNAPIIEDWESDSDKEDEPKAKVVRKIVESKTVEKDDVSKIVKPSYAKVEFVRPKSARQNKARMAHPHPKRNFVPTTVLTRSSKVSVNTAKQNLSKAAVSVNNAKPINTASSRPRVNDAKPRPNTFKKAHSSVGRPFKRITVKKNSNYTHRVNIVKGAWVNTTRTLVNTARPRAAVNVARSKIAVNTTRTRSAINTARPKAVLKAVRGNMGNAVKASTYWIWRPKQKVLDHGNLEQELQEKGIFDSGCSRHMTGNKAYLTNFEEINRGFVVFGGNSRGGKITGKGKIRIGKLDFEDVYFVKEIKFNLLSMSQICDKKNHVLFTDIECVVLSSDFKLPDENQFFLKVPKKHNMHSVDLKNTVPSGGNRVMNEFCEMKGIKMEFSIARTPEQNGVVERKNRTLIEAARLCRESSFSGFMETFGCLVTILNTIDHLGKVDGKADEGFLIGYSTNKKVFRVFNNKTKIVEENLHIQFNKNTPDIARSGPNWLFNIDALTKTMNYQPVSAENQSNGSAEYIFTIVEIPDQEYLLLPLWTSNSKSLDDKFVADAEKKDCDDQEKEDNVNSTNTINAASINEVNTTGTKTSMELPDDPNMPLLEEIVYSDDDEKVGAEADMNNLDLNITISLILTTRIHKDHPLDQVIGDV